MRGENRCWQPAGPLESYLSPGESREGKKGKGRGWEGRRREAGPVVMDSLCTGGYVDRV